MNVDKTKVMASEGILGNTYTPAPVAHSCRILSQNEQLEQVYTYPYVGSLITEDGECTIEFRTRLIREQAIGASLQKIWKSHSILISTTIRLMKGLVWPVATYGCENWALRKNEETRLDAFEMKGMRKKTNEWVLNKAGVKRVLSDTVKARKLAYYCHTIRKHESCLEKEERDNARNNGLNGRCC